MTVAILTLREHEEGIWITRLVERLKTLGIQNLLIHPIDHDSIERVDAVSGWTAVINRVSDAADPVLFKRTLAVLQAAKLRRIPIFNGPTSYSLCSSKWCHHLLFQEASLQNPPSVLVHQVHVESLQRASQELLQLEVPLPHLIKPNAGGFGRGIFRIDSEQDWDKYSDNSSCHFDVQDNTALVQQYVRPRDGKIYRVWFLNGQVQCAMERTIDNGDTSEFTTGCAASGVCSRRRRPATMIAWKVPSNVVAEIERLLLLLEDVHAGSVEFLYDATSGNRLYFDLNLLSTLPIPETLLNRHEVWSADYDPWMELAVCVKETLNLKGLSTVPTKILAVRHGESEFNVLRRVHSTEEERYLPVMYTPDASVTAKGMEQSRQAGRDVTKQLLSDDFLLVVSPLRRTLQTAQHMLEANCELRPCRIIVHPAAAEVMTDSCDIGTESNKLRNQYPHFDFGLLENEFWWPYGRSPSETWERMRLRQPEGLETEEMLQKRFDQLVTYLRTCQSKTVVLVCHSETIWWLTSYLRSGERFGIWTDNGEVLDITDHIIGNDQSHADHAG